MTSSTTFFFQDIILSLQHFWAKKGCVVLQPYDIEVGAGTSHTATSLRCLDANPWNVVYVQPCRRPNDGRYGENPNRMQFYYQMQVILKPSPNDIQNQSLESLKMLGISSTLHDIRFVESDWENPTLGAWGLGWEIWCDGMEIMQFTYMQQLGGLECKPIPGEITYGLERLAMYIQGVDSVWNLQWNEKVKYSDVLLRSEIEHCKYNFEYSNTENIIKQFKEHIEQAKILAKAGIITPAYEFCMKASHLFNLLDARGVLSVAERAGYIAEVRNVSRSCCQEWLLHTNS